MNNLQVFENKLIPIYETDIGEKVIDARELHKFLGVKTRFNDWINNRISEYGFQEGQDFYLYFSKNRNGGLGRPSKEYILTLDMGKELGMVERNEKGRQIRKYFIEVEKRVRKIAITSSDISDKRFVLESAKLLMPVMEELKLSPESKMTALKHLYEKAGVSLPFHVQLPDNLLTCTDIAKRLGIYSKSGKPHSQAIGAIIDMIDIKTNEVCVTMGTNENAQYSQNKYYPSVLEKVKGWLIIKGKPKKIETKRGIYNIQYIRKEH